MKKVGKILGIILMVIGAFLLLLWVYLIFTEEDAVSERTQPPKITQEAPAVIDETVERETERVPLATIAENLEIPWDVAFLPDGSMLVTERQGDVVHIQSGKTFPVEGVEHIGEGGLLGITLHPNFSENAFVYLYQTTRSESGALENRIDRYIYQDSQLSFEGTIFDGIPGARYHDGGRIAFGPDGFLYVTVGDATDEDEALNPNSLNGSILRINDDGSIPEDNPFGNAVYSYGHRNPQGLTWDDEGQLWSTEHGRSGALSGYDELNLIEKGGNYGWPESQGDSVASGTIASAAHSGATTTWAPASAQYYRGSVFFGGLRGETLYEAVVENGEVSEIKEHFVGEFGRIRTVTLGPDDYLYITTSNRDGRGDVGQGDDKIIRIDPNTL